MYYYSYQGRKVCTYLPERNRTYIVHTYVQGKYLCCNFSQPIKNVPRVGPEAGMLPGHPIIFELQVGVRTVGMYLECSR